MIGFRDPLRRGVHDIHGAPSPAARGAPVDWRASASRQQHAHQQAARQRATPSAPGSYHTAHHAHRNSSIVNSTDSYLITLAFGCGRKRS